ncbi:MULTISPECIES: hypothetical protein [Achromobacter]|uniref:hypothetical protein n=1 Tax=Achromobacter TaxID=222 RepID=UPI00207458FD|nr:MULTISPECIES: hypothetical protein [Achromobacter]MDH1303832.1 hypothetical protein [Achromobacter sp. GD03932]WLW59056.1 hypothetical protein RA224_17575 [Achromobacter aegrifaciens]
MKILGAVALLAAAWGQAVAQGAGPAIPQPPPSARVIPDACVGASCPRLVNPGATQEPCLGTGCATAGRPPGPPAPPSSGPSRQPGWVSPAPSRLPPMPAQRGVPTGPLTPAPPLPVPR